MVYKKARNHRAPRPFDRLWDRKLRVRLQGTGIKIPSQNPFL